MKIIDNTESTHRVIVLEIASKKSKTFSIAADKSLEEIGEKVKNAFEKQGANEDAEPVL